MLNEEQVLTLVSICKIYKHNEQDYNIQVYKKLILYLVIHITKKEFCWLPIHLPSSFRIYEIIGRQLYLQKELL